MASLVWIINVLLLVGVLALPAFSERIITSNYNSISKGLPIFELGKYQVMENPIILRKGQFSAPERLLIVTPSDAGLYPVLYFIHGTFISNEDYTQLFHHIASHGFIVVAPQLFSNILFIPTLPSQQEEIDMAATVANWLPSNLQHILQEQVGEGVKPDLNKLAISGHSRGGKTAFALALNFTQNTKLSVKISALIGVDPVAGRSKRKREKPYVLTYKPNSLKLSIPITVIGTGLGNVTRIGKPCAPNQVNHQDFFDEIKQGSHFVIKEYGHVQMLNNRVFDVVGGKMMRICAPGRSPTTTMRRTSGGIIVAFLDAYFSDQEGQYLAIIDNPSLAPTKLYVQTKSKFGFAVAS